ncbi:MAG: hypothetical protein ABIQ38_04390 [Ilumatobacteraceae bacterium]
MIANFTLPAEHPYVGGIRALFRTALFIFVVTVSIGILNGTDLINFDHQALMGHVHSGTLGWISLSVFAASLWLFGESGSAGWHARIAKALPASAIIAIVAYVSAFFSTTDVRRPIAGSVALVVVLVFMVWVAAQSRHVILSVPRLGVLAAITTLAIGAVLGVLLGLEQAGTIDFMPSGVGDAHPAIMVVGFLIPMGMALTEWRLTPEKVDQIVDRAGRIQIAAPFLGGVLLMIGALLDVTPLIGMSLPLEVIGIVIFIRRLRVPMRAVDWARGGWERGSVATAVFLVLDIALLVYIIVRYKGQVDEAPAHLLLSLDHMMFIGVMTNSLFGRVDGATKNRRWPSVDNVAFWAMNIGLVVFAFGLLIDVTALKQAGAPVMGTAILIGIATMSVRLSGPTARAPVSD